MNSLCLHNSISTKRINYIRFPPFSQHRHSHAMFRHPKPPVPRTLSYTLCIKVVSCLLKNPTFSKKMMVQPTLVSLLFFIMVVVAVLCRNGSRGVLAWRVAVPYRLKDTGWIRVCICSPKMLAVRITDGCGCVESGAQNLIKSVEPGCAVALLAGGKEASLFSFRYY